MTVPTEPTNPPAKSNRSIWNDIGVVVLGAVLMAIFITDGAATGVVCAVIALLIFIAVKVSHIAKAAKR